jgi:predicted dehydrogenase
LRYPDDVLVNLHVSWLNPRKSRDITVVGESQMLVLDDMDIAEPLRIYDKGIAGEAISAPFTDTFASFRASIREGDIRIPRVSLGEPLKAECDHFLECIRYGKEPLTGGREGLQVLRALEAIERSAGNGGQAEQVS